ncbi:peptidoglycan-binding domain-containing protein [Vallicoccus soli]|uniref:Uncharacterized protein n=1 Tax=Vallicoccus soli TaxID=2339232 RepID=A0A3A3YZS3_9ACTN|nr:peptidoglycan-binding domain-containing protein [Vallicoccus soli]RJK96383.1 hypothetical protein D5H78_09115 [Vallicoccus soli]
MTFAAWEQATTCTGGPTPGAKALMAGVLEAYGPRGATNLGIYNCRSVAGSSTTSCHGEGRACDVGFPVEGGRAHPAGHDLVRALLPFAGRLGLQALIWDRTIWSARSPGGRPYTGVSPHVDHVHAELTRAGGRDLTRSTVRQALSGTAAPLVPTPRTGSGTQRPRLRLGSRGAEVALVQRFLGVRDDGVFGERTRAAVLRYQRDRGLEADGVVGPRTWARIDAVLAPA